MLKITIIFTVGDILLEKALQKVNDNVAYQFLIRKYVFFGLALLPRRTFTSIGFLKMLMC